MFLLVEQKTKREGCKNTDNKFLIVEIPNTYIYTMFVLYSFHKVKRMVKNTTIIND